MTIKLLPNNGTLPSTGVVFWWSNILRSYQLRVYTDSGEVAALSQLHIERLGVEAAAKTLATMLNLAAFEIEVEAIEVPGQPQLPTTTA